MITFLDHERSSQKEIMDDFKLAGKDMQLLMADLERVNTYLGGNHITWYGIKTLLHKSSQQEFTILDVGCGDGALMRYCADKANTEGLKIRWIGLDANPNILEEASSKSGNYSQIEYSCRDILAAQEELPKFDIALCTLVLHHFKEEEIKYILNLLCSQAKVGIVINDLERSRMAFELFKLFSRLFLKTKIAAHDGLVSIARAFKKEELKTLSKSLNGIHQIRWKWAFRYQWIIKL